MTMIMEQKQTTIEWLIKEIVQAKRQLDLFSANNRKDAVSEALLGRIEFIRSYSKAIKYIDLMRAKGYLDGLNMANYERRIDAVIRETRDASV